MNQPVRCEETDAGIKVVSSLVQSTSVQLSVNATNCAFSCDGSEFAVSLGDGSLEKFDQSSGGEDSKSISKGHKVQIHDGPAIAVEAISDGFVTAGHDGKVFFVMKDNILRELMEFGQRWVECLCVSPAKSLISAAAGSCVAISNLQGKKIVEIDDFPSTVSGLAFDKSGGRLAVSHYDGVTVLNVKTGEKELVLEWKGSHIGVSWSADERYLVSATQERELHAWDLVTLKDFRMGGYPRKVHHMDWFNCAKLLVCSGADVITAWSFDGSGPGHKPPMEIGYIFGGTVSAVAAHPNRQIVAGGFSNGSVLIGATVKGEALVAHAGIGSAVSALQWSPQGSELLAVTEAGELSLIAVPEELGVT